MLSKKYFFYIYLTFNLFKSNKLEIEITSSFFAVFFVFLVNEHSL